MASRCISRLRDYSVLGGTLAFSPYPYPEVMFLQNPFPGYILPCLYLSLGLLEVKVLGDSQRLVGLEYQRMQVMENETGDGGVVESLLSSRGCMG